MLFRVIKLGGSLLDYPELVPALRRWLAKHPADKNLIVVGGGGVIEAIRSLDKIHRLNAHFVHWKCVELLRHTAEIASHLFPEFAMVSTAEQLEATTKGTASRLTAIVQVPTFYSQERPHPDLPENWNTTTDSIAALLACELAAQELVLLKSVQPEAGTTSLAAWAGAGLVDECFPKIAGKIPRVRMLNLRHRSSTECRE